MPAFEAIKLKDLLELLDAKWSVALAAAISSAALLYLQRTGSSYFVGAPYWLPLVLLIVLIVSSAVTAIWLIKAMWSFIEDVRKRQKLEARKEEVLEYLDSLTDQERHILSYCLMANYRSFTATLIQEELATLIQKGLVQRASGQFSMLDWPHVIPKFVWDRMVARADEFRNANPHEPPPFRRRRF